MSELFKKLLEVKKKVPYLQKDKKSFQYSYATPSKVLGTLNPLLNDAGLLLKSEVISATHQRVFVKHKKDKTSGEFIDVYETLYDLELRFTWVDVDTGDKDENMFFASGLNGDEKGVGSALTYGERYFLLKYFNIPTDDDDPDSFQEKQMSEDEKKEEVNKKKEEDIENWRIKIIGCQMKQELTTLWGAMPSYIQSIHKNLVAKTSAELKHKTVDKAIKEQQKLTPKHN
jgi:hypothetical protein